MKLLHVVFLCLLFTTNIAQTQWEQISTINTPQLNAVKFFNESTGITVGQGGIWRSTNSGFNWTQIISTGRFNAISFSDVNNGTAVGESGLIMRTSDNGMSWFQEFSHTTNNLNAIPPLLHHDKYVSHENQIAGFQDDKYEMKISLSKYSYKKYEPINLNIQVINHDSKQLELTEGFQPVEKACDVTIIDEYGQTTGGIKTPGELTFAYTSPTYVVQPGDTLFTTMSINDWGKSDRESRNFDNIYFHYGYFECGKYTAYLSRWFDLMPDKNNGVYVNSNKVEFEVTELTFEDKEVLRLLKQQIPGDTRYLKELVSIYPNGSFAEHLYAYYLKGHSRIMTYEEYDWKDSLESDYKNFITKYPNSSYLLIDRFVAPYIYKHFIELNNLKDSFESEIEDFKSLNRNNALRIFLNDKRRSKRILRIE